MKCLWHRVFADHSFYLEGSLIRRIYSALLAFALILSMMPVVPMTVYATDPHYTYTTYEGRTATITGCDTSVSGDIVIPELMGGYYKVTRIGDYAFRNCKNITSIIIPNGVTSIGTSAFSGCTNLTSITIPDTVTSIGENAFYGCSKLMSITIPESVTSIADGAFQGCSSLTNVTIPGNITGISNSTFAGCSGLTSVTIPDSVTSIGDYAFSGCSKLSVITIPDSITHIGYHTFYNCNSLTFNAYDNATYLEYAANPYYALVDVSSASITSCKIHKNTKIIGSVFYKCNKLTSITIESGVTSISDYAFWQCDDLTTITLPDSVITIGREAFGSCTGLTSVTIPNSVTSMDDYAFRNCFRLSQVHITDIAAWCNISFSDITANPLYNGASLCIDGESVTVLTIPDGVTSIGNYAFSGYSSLTNITIPNSVTNFGNSAFDSCTNLAYNTYDTAMYLGNTENPYHVLVNVPSNDVTACEIHANTKIIGPYAFSCCRSLTNITIPDGVTSIGEYAFWECDSLTNLNIPYSVTSIGYRAFYGSLGLTYNTYDNAKYLGNAENPFHVLVRTVSTTITDCEINENTKIIYSEAFYNCSNLTKIAIPEGVADIGNSAFYECDSLTDIVIPDSVTSIEDHTFRDCISLYSITIPDSITSVGYYAFNDCYELEHIWYCGDENDRANITVDCGNACFENAIWHYNCCDLEDHIFDTICDFDCNICDYERTDIHAYDNTCDPECNECGEIRFIKHTYDNNCDAICNVCSFTRTTQHVYDSVDDLSCNVCKHSLTPSAPVLLSNEPDTIVLQEQSGLEYSIDGIVWQKSNTFAGLSHLNTYTFYQRVAQSSTAFVSEVSPGLTVTTIDKYTPDIPADFTFVEITDTSVRLNGVENCEYSMDGISWQTSSLFTNLMAGTQYTFYQRTVENSKQYASSPAVLLITTLYQLGTITYDLNGGNGELGATKREISTQIPTRSGYRFIGWALAPNTYAVYSPGDCYNQQADIVLYAVWAEPCETCGGEEEYFRKCPRCSGTGLGSKEYCSSCGGDGVVYIGVSCPVDYCYNGTLILNGTYQGTCSTCKGDGIFEEPSNCGNCEGGLLIYPCSECSGYGGMQVQCSQCVSGVQKNTPNAPDAPELQSVSSKTVILVGYSTCEYSKDGTTWQGSNVFSSLDPNTQYSFYQRYKGTTYNNSSAASPALKVTTTKECILPPSQPVLQSETFNKVVLEKVNGCEYSIDGINWQADNVFADLNPSTSYTFYCRFAETSTHLCSAASDSLTVVTEDSPLFNVVFADWNGTVISSNTYRWGDEVSVPRNPAKAADNTYTYTFVGWDNAVVNCKGDATYTATYAATYIDYTVVFKNWNGTVLSTEIYHWGDTVTTPVNPYRPSDDTYIYTFTGWDKMVIACCGNAEYTAVYSSQTRVPSTITTSAYTVSGTTISKITAGTTVSSLLSGFNEGSYCKVYKGNTEVSGSTTVGTGMVVKIMDGNTVKASYTIIVAGDTNGDGNITVTDMIAIKAHVLKKTTLSGVYATAADTNGDNGISITDFIQVKAKILGKGTITAR